MIYDLLDTPVGVIAVAGDDAGIRHLDFQRSNRPLVIEDHWKRDPGFFSNAREQLDAYFAGELKDFDLLLAPVGTNFQKQVWDALRTIPYGRLVSYRDVARKINNPNACRAVGAANGKNPVGIVIPCHRVVGSNGKLTGYAGGLDIKEWLIKLEGGTI